MATTTTELPLVERHWTIPEIETETGVSQSTMRRAVAAGHVKYLDVGSGNERRSIRIPDSELRRWFASRTNAARRTA